MKYILSHNIPKRKVERSTIKSWNGRVVDADPIFKWMIGKDIAVAIRWLTDHNWSIEITE